ncbi:MAG: nucleoside diphosphate kinase regulator [Anaerolineae bacterium]|nr:nucleoside diphosphate kinase regulator [Anaerolineae bacterium]
MKHRDIYITDLDLKRLRELLESAQRFNEYDPADLAELAGELVRAQVVPSAQVPADVITMNSTVCLEDLETGEEMTYTLVFPNEADIDQDKISVLAPIGTAMLGYRVGDTLEWPVPGGISRLQVKQILYQPEANGVAEAEGVDFSPAVPARWQETLAKLSKYQETFDDYA